MPVSVDQQLQAKAMSHHFHPNVLREYDIRGTVGENINSLDAYYIGKSFGTVLLKDGLKTVCVGYDGRLSSPILKNNLVRGLVETGIKIIEVGKGPSPMLYHSVYYHKADAGVMVTGSHNPANQNGFKFLKATKPFFGKDITNLGKIASIGDFIENDGIVEKIQHDQFYIQNLVSKAKDYSPLKIAWDCGNGSTGEIVEKLTRLINGKHYLLHTEIDGTFPNHHPDPTDIKNLKDIQNTVLKEKCDIGIAFDGDGDRIGVIDSKARVIWGDQLLTLFAKEILDKKPNSTIIADVKASQTFFDEVKKYGGNPVMWKSGHSHIKSKLIEMKAPLAGEMSSHIFFADDYYGFDDALYAAIRLLNIIVSQSKTLDQLFDSLPKTFNTPELRIDCPDDKKFLLIEEIKNKLKEENIPFFGIDGIRRNTNSGWWLLRASNTQPMIVVRCEANNQENLDKIVDEVKSYLEGYNITF